MVFMTWIKICGITNLEDALVAVEAGADALGFVFYQKSSRSIHPEQVRAIGSELPPHIDRVGLFVNQQENHICEVADRAALTAVQMHGDDEDPHIADLVVALRPLKVFVAVPMQRPQPEAWAGMWKAENVNAFLADSGNGVNPGGTGKTFDWRASLAVLNAIKRLGNLIVAGGLNSSNVSSAIEITRPWGVDVSSGVEARAGKKDPEKLRAFIKAVRERDKAN
jgi:phosphoribosylanthranilate isomerase